ncbi:MAG TPA: phosphotransferase [Nocardioidaceae bacterium]|nr:phosphotransferase [Nocardioidaceae bacterium]
MTVGSFEDALRPTSVVAELAATVPELVDGRLALLACRISRIRSLSGQKVWTAIYELDVRDAATGREQTLVARGMLTPSGVALADVVDELTFGADGWSRTVPALRLRLVGVVGDDALPGLDAIIDPGQGRLMLEMCLRADGRLPPGTDLIACVPTVVTHKSGVRATVVCRLRYDDDQTTAPRAVLVKVHHDDTGKRAFEAMRALSRASGDDIALAESIDYLPGLHLSIQEYVEHRCTLKDLFHSGFDAGTEAWDQLVLAMRATALGLAALHSSSCAVGEPVSWEQELATLRAKQDRLTRVVPALTDRIGPVPDRLASAAASVPGDPLGPAHHSFRPAQVLLTEDGVAFIDFDNYCRAEPASDIALFTAKLQHMAVNKVTTSLSESSRRVRFAELRGAFLDEYRRHAPVSPGRVALWEALELTSLVLSAAKKVNEPWLDTCQRMLEDHLRSCGW